MMTRRGLLARVGVLPAAVIGKPRRVVHAWIQNIFETLIVSAGSGPPAGLFIYDSNNHLIGSAAAAAGVGPIGADQAAAPLFAAYDPATGQALAMNGFHLQWLTGGPPLYGTGNGTISVTLAGNMALGSTGNLILQPAGSEQIIATHGIGTPVSAALLEVQGALTTGQLDLTEASPQTLVNGSTITPATASGSYPVTEAGAVTGIIMAAGTFGGQTVVIINTAAFAINFAVPGTSRVASGTTPPIAPSQSAVLIWDSGTSLWYLA